MPPGGGRTWWAHFEFTRINIELIILRKKIEELREARESMFDRQLNIPRDRNARSVTLRHEVKIVRESSSRRDVLVASGALDARTRIFNTWSAVAPCHSRPGNR